MQVARWGNSLAVRIPADVARALGIKEGDDIQLTALSQHEVGIITEQQQREAAIQRLREYRGWMPADYEFDRDEANAH